MDSLTIAVIGIVFCFAVILITGFLEVRLKKKKEAEKDHADATPLSDLTVGRIYQMEDGSFAKYTGNGRFLKVKK